MLELWPDWIIGWPSYKYHIRGPTHLGLRPRPPVDRQHADAGFERFRGWALRVLGRLYPGALFHPHSQNREVNIYTPDGGAVHGSLGA